MKAKYERKADLKMASVTDEELYTDFDDEEEFEEDEMSEGEVWDDVMSSWFSNASEDEIEDALDNIWND